MWTNGKDEGGAARSLSLNMVCLRPKKAVHGQRNIELTRTLTPYELELKRAKRGQDKTADFMLKMGAA
eukprot:13214251-Alexandrium_andersonii.AAC.1